MVRIIVDSASDISLAQSQKLGVTMVAMGIKFGEDEFLDGVTLSSSEFYDKLIESDVMPKTSMINPFRWEEEFEKVVAQGDEAVVVTISSKLSGTYESARQASERFGGKVFVVDSLNASVGERLLCYLALKMRDEGKSASEIASVLDEQKQRICIMAMLNTLEYLKKGGRISSTVAFVGEVLSIKPVVSIVDGEVKMVGKAIGSKNGNNLLNRLVEKNGIDFSMPLGLIWSGNDDSVLKKYVRDSARLWEEHTDEIPAYAIGSTIGTHVGPGAIGVAFFAQQQKEE